MDAFLVSTSVVALAEIGDKTQLLAFILAAKFRKPVGPGDCLHIRVDKQQSRKNVWKFASVATVGGVKVAEAIICAMIVE